MGTRRVESFLLRIVVPEGQPIDPQQWRGRIQHVTSGAEQQIDELSQAIAFITAHLSTMEGSEFSFEPTPAEQ